MIVPRGRQVHWGLPPPPSKRSPGLSVEEKAPAAQLDGRDPG